MRGRGFDAILNRMKWIGYVTIWVWGTENIGMGNQKYAYGALKIWVWGTKNMCKNSYKLSLESREKQPLLIYIYSQIRG